MPDLLLLLIMACPQKAPCPQTAGPWRPTRTLPAPTTPPPRPPAPPTPSTTTAENTPALQPRHSHWTADSGRRTSLQQVEGPHQDAMWHPWAGLHQDTGPRPEETPRLTVRGSSRLRNIVPHIAVSPLLSQNTTSPLPLLLLPPQSLPLKRPSTPPQALLPPPLRRPSPRPLLPSPVPTPLPHLLPRPTMYPPPPTLRQVRHLPLLLLLHPEAPSATRPILRLRTPLSPNPLWTQRHRRGSRRCWG